MFKDHTQTLTNKTLTSPVITTPQINDTSSNHQYVFAASELDADRTVTLPLLADNDEFVFKDHTQTLTNKTLTSPVMTNVDINSGTIDGATIATSDITVGAGKTLDVSAGTLTLANNQISGNAIDGGTIDSITITELAGDLTLSNSANKTIKIADTASGAAGKNLTVKAGSTPNASGNTNGGNLVLSSGDSDGSGVSHVIIQTNASEVARFDSAGNLGIGVTDPDQKLEVSGIIHISGEQGSTPGAPSDGDGGLLYVKSDDGKLYFRSNDVSETDLTSGGGGGGASTLDGLSDVSYNTTTNSLYVGEVPSNLGSDAVNNTSLGDSALVNINSTSGNDADNNTAIGYNAGNSITTGKENTLIGSGAATDNSAGYNQTSLGYGAVCSDNNQVTLGNSSITELRCGATTIASLSDRRDKTDIIESEYGLNFVEKLKPVQFTWKRRELEEGDINNPHNGKKRLGFIAQDFQDAMPDGENDILDLVNEANPERIEAKYGNLIPILVKSIQELQQKVQSLETIIQDLKK